MICFHLNKDLCYLTDISFFSVHTNSGDFMNTIWQQETLNYPKLQRNINRDIVVVGGGITGALICYQLAEANKTVTLVEANELFGSATSHTEAKISALQGIFYHKLNKKYGIAFTKQVYLSQQNAITKYEELFKKHHIKCEFTRLKGYLFSRQEKNLLHKEFDTLKKCGAPVAIADFHSIPFPCINAFSLENQAQFDPLSFLYQLPKKYEIFEHTKIMKIKGQSLYTEQGYKITAKTIIIATQFPIKNFLGFYPFRMYQSSSYVVANSSFTHLEGTYLEDIEDGLSLRQYRNNILLGGYDHRTGKQPKQNPFLQLEQNLKQQKQPIHVTAYWRNEDAMTFDRLPYIGRFSRWNPNLYVATGFNKWGMTNAMIASILIRDLILGNQNPDAFLYSPQRMRIPRYPISFIEHASKSVFNLLKPILRIPFHTSKDLRLEEAKIVWYRGKRKAVYKDRFGVLHAINPKCGHFHCELSFNPTTKTWDCPCHGSIYDIDGKIIHGPASKTLNK